MRSLFNGDFLILENFYISHSLQNHRNSNKRLFYKPCGILDNSVCRFPRTAGVHWIINDWISLRMPVNIGQGNVEVYACKVTAAISRYI